MLLSLTHSLQLMALSWQVLADLTEANFGVPVDNTLLTKKQIRCALHLSPSSAPPTSRSPREPTPMPSVNVGTLPDGWFTLVQGALQVEAVVLDRPTPLKVPRVLGRFKLGEDLAYIKRHRRHISIHVHPPCTVIHYTALLGLRFPSLILSRPISSRSLRSYTRRP